MKKILNKFVNKNVSNSLNLPNWKKLLKNPDWKSVLKSSQKGQNVLLATSVGIGESVIIVDSLLAVALTMRGAKVHILLCDNILPSCEAATFQEIKDIESFLIKGPQKFLCERCFSKAYKLFKEVGVNVYKYSDFLTSNDNNIANDISSTVLFDEISSFKLNGLAIGEHSIAGALRFFAKSDLRGECYSEEIVRRYFKAGLLTAIQAENAFKQLNIQVASFHHGIYIPQGIIGEVARKQNVRVVNWAVAYRKQRFIFSHNDTYHHTLMTEPTQEWENIPWAEERDAELMSYLKSRWHGSFDWIKFHDKSVENLEAVSQSTGIDFNKTCIGMLTNVAWDAQLHYPANAFSNMIDWIIDTVKYFKERQDLQLIIRVHPAELKGIISRQTVVGELNKNFQEIPSNVYVIGPESPYSTYALMQACNCVLIYGTKTGVELSCMGIPIIVAGEAWIRNKSITIDVKSRHEYHNILNMLPLTKKLNDEEILRAKKYAYHFFFRRMIPVRVLYPTDSFPPFKLKISSIKDLQEGKDLGLDTICEGIIENKKFIYDE